MNYSRTSEGQFYSEAEVTAIADDAEIMALRELRKKIDKESDRWMTKWNSDPSPYTEGRMDGLEWVDTLIYRMLDKEND